MRIPKKLGSVVDLLGKTEQNINDITATIKKSPESKAVERLKFQKAELELHLMDTFGEEELSAATGKLAKLELAKTKTFKVEDWPALRKYINRSKAYDIYQSRVNSTAIKERIDNGKVVPGVEEQTTLKLKVKFLEK